MSALAQLIAQAEERSLVVADLAPSLLPQDPLQAYAVQDEILHWKNSNLGGWKVGAQNHEAPARGSLIPSSHIHRSGGVLLQPPFAQSGLELELYFQLGRNFSPSSTPYSTEEILDAVAGFGAAIEIVSSRFKEWPNIDRLLQLADLQNNGALILGERVPYRQDYAYLSPKLQFEVNGVNVAPASPTNPAGDPRRLLAWAVNHCTTRGKTFTTDMVITTGTYTGLHFPQQVGMAMGQFHELPPVTLNLH